MNDRPLPARARRLGFVAALLLGAMPLGASASHRPVREIAHRHSATADTTPPRRPRLSDSADTRDWRAYERCAILATDYDRAVACLYWAQRLDPARPEPYFAQYMLSDLKDTAALSRALVLDPFIHQARVVTVTPPRPGAFTSVERRAWLALQGGDFFAASRHFQAHLRAKPDDVEARWGAAIAEYYRGRFDVAAEQLAAVAEIVRRRQSERTRNYYSLELAEYAAALAYLRAGSPDSTRAALERSFAEDLAFYPAQMALADLALAEGDSARAVSAWASAAELYRDDQVARERHARFLTRVGRRDEAERLLRIVIAAEPHWVDARRTLAELLDAQGEPRRADALAAWEEFLRRAPAEPAEPRRAAEGRIGALRTP